MILKYSFMLGHNCLASFLGETAIFSCTITGEPTPEVHWLVNGQRIVESDHLSVEYDSGVCTLTINQTTTTDEAIYLVEAVNRVGKVSVSANLVLIRKYGEV